MIVNGFATASIVYVTVNGIPSVLWKSKALPVNTNDPVLMGVLVTLTGVLLNIVIVDNAYLLPSIHLALYGWPCAVSGVTEGLYL